MASITDNMTVFFDEEGIRCDPFSEHVAICATFAVGGLIVDVRCLDYTNTSEEGSIMREIVRDAVTLSKPVETVEDVREAIDYWLSIEWV